MAYKKSYRRKRTVRSRPRRKYTGRKYTGRKKRQWKAKNMTTTIQRGL